MVALMTDLLEITKQDMVLEVGTGLGYQTAILAELADQVFTIEIHEELAHEAQQRLCQAGVNNIRLRIGDGSRGWPEYAPYDKIMVTAAPERLPSALLEQLKPGGKMVIPVGQADEQKLTLVSMHTDGRVRTQELLPVLFSPLTISH
jgi:protein-L-isoaspartate(D-aspartate) O-methyltransferase